MKLFLTFVLCIMLQSVANAQYDPKDYNAFNGKTEVAFHDDFDDDRNNWFALYSSPPGKYNSETTIDVDETGYDGALISDGIFRFVTAGPNDSIFRGCEIARDIDYSRNFEVTIRIKVGRQKDKPGTGIVYWGRKAKTVKGYNLYIRQNCELDIHYCYRRRKYRTKNWTNINVKKACTSDDFNIYTIRKYSNSYYVFANGTFFYSVNAIPINGKILGVGGLLNSETLIDYLTISYLP